MPIFVEGRLSNFFYNLSRLRKALGVKANIEMLWLVDEMLSQKGQHFRIIVGEPIEVESLREVGSRAAQVLEVRKACYALEKELKKSTK